MRKYYYDYIIYQNEYPVFSASTIAEIAHYLGCGAETLRVKAADQKAALGKIRETYRYYNEEDECYDYSQLYYHTRKYEIYRFWSSEN